MLFDRYLTLTTFFASQSIPLVPSGLPLDYARDLQRDTDFCCLIEDSDKNRDGDNNLI